MTKEKKLQQYHKCFGEFYAQYPELWDIIQTNIQEDNYFVDAVRQVAYATKILPEKYNVYKGFLEIVKKYYSLAQNICEIGAGFYPVLSRDILKEQQRLEKGTITAIDPDIILPKHSKIKIKKESITSDTDLHKYDLLLAYMACDATIPIINIANHYHKPYVIGLCGCLHESYNPFLPISYQVRRQHEFIICYAQNHLESNMELAIETLPEQYEIDFPILVKKRK